MTSLVNAGFLVQVCFLVSSLCLVTSLQKSSLTDQPRLSSTLVLILTGCFTLLASLVSRWLPWHGNKHDSTSGHGEQALSLFVRHRKSVLAITLLVALRVEIFQRVMDEVQCSGKGIEAFLPMLLAAHEFVVQHPPPRAVSDDPPEMWGSFWEDVVTWFKESPISLLASSIMISLGVLLSMDLLQSSTYFCSTIIDSQRSVLLMQFVGVVTDAGMILMTRALLLNLGDTTPRLRALGLLLLNASALIAFFHLVARSSGQAEPVDLGSYRDLAKIYATDLVSISAVAAAVLISLMLWTIQAGPIVPVGLATYLCGLILSVQYTLYIGSFEQISPDQPLVVMVLLFIGVTVFLNTTTQRRAARIRRFFVVVVLFGVLLFSITFSLLGRYPFGRHRVAELVYSKRVETDRWLRHATASDSLKSAVIEYRERHHGRSPPPNFDKWYEYAMEHKSAVMDMYNQIGKDIMPFWGMHPRQIREGVDILRRLPDVGVVTIKQGIASHVANSASTQQKEWLDDMVDLISPFAEHLPDMSLAFNLGRRPKVLSPWEDIHLLTEAGQRQGKLVLDRPQRPQQLPALFSGYTDAVAKASGNAQHYLSVKTFRQLQALACPPGSPTRRGLDEGARDFCSSCAHPHSIGQFLNNWEKALDHCHQPDVFNLHEFYTLPHQSDLFQDLLPLFSTSKTDSFNDILVPHPSDAKRTPSWAEGAKTSRPFDKGVDIVSWQGNVSDAHLLTPKSHHGSHRNRLVHLLRNASSTDKVALLVGWKSGDEENAPRFFHHEKVPTKNANGVLPFAVDFTNKDGCTTEVCRLLEAELGGSTNGAEAAAQQQQDDNKDDGAWDNDNHRYKIILDTQDGPFPSTRSTPKSPSFLHALYSPAQLPILSSIFCEWYTERLTPWAHFIPLDLRYHALHSTVAYFVGLTGRGPLNGRTRSAGDMDAQTQDAKWIAEEGSRWARKALRRSDMEIYMFRLLLEWGRVISDDRVSLMYQMPAAA
ncbi:uncharacterized protein B0I36DRAFT_327688 [Microdochium trichocladiopsis]|uniref:Glycosyl transferase CAP10 domain-containing protein n=1 Tax=Microdochium trichocladiopsis TaxID=1682393 RepID=A0A9P8Y4Y6_9PEZI|nr:uncharacterized protein B0I36DRAFT_327688 [Microdochium trichocladiopsis]KAH7027710.1 hypothetical protein B0I36DRAFT_327688 [Microdochium trichocladiopsis]